MIFREELNQALLMNVFFNCQLEGFVFKWKKTNNSLEHKFIQDHILLAEDKIILIFVYLVGK